MDVVDHARWSGARRAAAAVAVLLLGTLLVLAAPASPASAHAALLTASPPAGALVGAMPTAVVLTFNEPVRLVPGRIQVVAPDGQRADRDEPTVEGPVLTIPLRPDGPLGTYLVSYRVISTDSHPVAGGYTFSVGAVSTPPELPAEPEVDPSVAWAIPVGKFLGYLGLLLLAGPLLVLNLLWPERLSRRWPARLAWGGVGLVGLGTLLGLWLQGPYTRGASLFEFTGADLGDVLSSQFGAAHVVRAGVLAALALVIPPILAGRGSRADHVVLGILAVVGLGTWPAAGHAVASPVPAISVVMDATHLAAMAVWLGGLVMLAAFLLRQATEPELEAILPAWSRWAALAVSALVLAGIVQALVEVGTPQALVGTTYGRLVLAKLGLFLVVLAVAAYSRQLVRTRRAAGRPAAMRRAVVAELVVTAVVLGVSAVLVQTTPARVADADDALVEVPYHTATASTQLYSLQVEITPARIGNNSVHLYAYTPDGQPLPVQDWRATVSRPEQELEAIDVPLLRITDNHAIGEIALPSPGEWEFRFTLRVSDLEQASVAVTVPIR